ncbi:hypothetical protein [Meiothermus sp.]|uniref:hypothetical protein n=1 Tax=Meiothermus sp. TaxID=1955249 RepID=UPI0021DDDA43|nr:hypothetical protein [Meiothermus sp.]GIW33765.1 MAG: hypothetical protein KatS3mg072_1098 [Meiothermus sp.]GIW36267.1 MAG: hypothetical protein KatS3mg073_0412 [Meiothermus sp.]GIW38928.1 MAG: hypothetical protein KatS3mg075_409 [Meiothermus sp.]
MKLQLPETLLTQPVETPTGITEGVPLESEQLDPIVTEAVESQPAQPTHAKESENAKEKTPEKRTGKGKSLPIVGIALAALAAVVAVASQGNYGSPTIRAEQPHTPQPAGGNRGIVWE